MAFLAKYLAKKSPGVGAPKETFLGKISEKGACYRFYSKMGSEKDSQKGVLSWECKIGGGGANVWEEENVPENAPSRTIFWTPPKRIFVKERSRAMTRDGV